MFSLFNKMNKIRKRKYYVSMIKLNRNQKFFIRRNRFLSQKFYKFKILCLFRDIKKLNVVVINLFLHLINKNTKMLTLIKVFEHVCEVKDFEQFRKVNEKLINSFKSLCFINNVLKIHLSQIV